MKIIIILMMLALLSGITLNCSLPNVPADAFRVKTRGKFHLFGIPLPISVPNPNIALNLKTIVSPTPVNKVIEYNPGGAFITTNNKGFFDAENAYLPAVWTARPAPSQSLCLSSATAQTSFNAVAGGTYRFDCRWNLQVQFLVQPNQLDLSESGQNGGGNGLTGISAKGLNDEARFANASNLKIRYYKQIDGEDYELEQEHPATSVSADGTEAVFPIPNRLGNEGLVNYKLIIVEDDAQYDSFVGYGDLEVIFPTIGTGCFPITSC